MWKGRRDSKYLDSLGLAESKSFNVESKAVGKHLGKSNKKIQLGGSICQTNIVRFNLVVPYYIPSGYLT